MNQHFIHIRCKARDLTEFSSGTNQISAFALLAYIGSNPCQRSVLASSSHRNDNNGEHRQVKEVQARSINIIKSSLHFHFLHTRQLNACLFAKTHILRYVSSKNIQGQRMILTKCNKGQLLSAISRLCMQGTSLSSIEYLTKSFSTNCPNESQRNLQRAPFFLVKDRKKRFIL